MGEKEKKQQKEKERIKDLKIELKARKLVLAKLETALKPLQAKAERQGRPEAGSHSTLGNLPE